MKNQVKYCIGMFLPLLILVNTLYASIVEDGMDPQCVEIVTNFIRAYNGGNIEEVKNYFSPTATIRVLRSDTYETHAMGRDKFIDAYLTDWEESHFSVLEMGMMADTIILRVNRVLKYGALPAISSSGIDRWRLTRENPPKIIFMDIVPDKLPTIFEYEVE